MHGELAEGHGCTRPVEVCAQAALQQSGASAQRCGSGRGSCHAGQQQPCGGRACPAQLLRQHLQEVVQERSGSLLRQSQRPAPTSACQLVSIQG